MGFNHKDGVYDFKPIKPSIIPSLLVFHPAPFVLSAPPGDPAGRHLSRTRRGDLAGGGDFDLRTAGSLEHASGQRTDVCLDGR